MGSITFPTAELFRFAIVLSRVAGIVVFAPFFSSRSIPFQIKIVFSLMATVGLLPCLPLTLLPADMGTGGIITEMFNSALIGMGLGVVASFVFAGMQTAGQVIAFQLGFSIANVIDPQSEVEAPVFSFLQNYIGLLFFLLINGHHWFFLAVADSFNYLPAHGIHLQGSLVQLVIRLSAQMLAFGVQIAGPVIAVTVLTDIVIGIIGRASPQLNILMTTMPLKILVGFGSVSISLYFLSHLLGGAFSSLYSSLFVLVKRMV
jgi:flagellar biosynthesis protein FliR